MKRVNFALRGDFIALDALLKASGVASSGGAAKMLIADGAVRVNAVVEKRRGKKLRNGETVSIGEIDITIRHPENENPSEP